MASPGRQGYSEAVRRRLVERVLIGGESVGSVAKGEGINTKTLSRWVRLSSVSREGELVLDPSLAAPRKRAARSRSAKVTYEQGDIEAWTAGEVAMTEALAVSAAEVARLRRVIAGQQSLINELVAL